jgi:hypothetical protein
MNADHCCPSLAGPLGGSFFISYNAPGEVLAGMSFRASSQDSVNGESPAIRVGASLPEA